jgi:hypothetical protein
MGLGYAVLCNVMGEVVSRQDDVLVWEVRPDIHHWRYTNPGGTGIQAFDQPPLHEIARYFGEFWTGGKSLPLDNGLYNDRQVEVLGVTLEPGRLRVTVRPLRGG